MKLKMGKSKGPVDDFDDAIPTADPTGDPDDATVIPGDGAEVTSGSTRGYLMPLNSFDLLEGAGRSKAATSRMNIIIIGIVMLLIGASAFVAQQAVSARDDLTTDLAALDTEISRTTQAIRQRSSSILPEGQLVTHRQDRRQIILDSLGSQLPYETVFANLTAVADEVGVTIERLTFESSERDGGLVVSGTAPNLDVLGLWSVELTARHGISRVGGYIETIDQTYTTDQGSEALTFQTRMRVNTAQLSDLTACTRVELYLDGEVPECAEVLESLGPLRDGTATDEFGDEADIDPALTGDTTVVTDPAPAPAADPVATTDGEDL